MDINVNVRFEKEVIDFLKSVTVEKAIKQETANITNIANVTKEEKNTTTQKETVKQDATDTEHEITIDDVRKAFKTIKDKKGADAAKDLLKDLGYKKIPDIEAEKYAEILERVKEAV